MNSVWTAFSRPVLSRAKSSTGSIPPPSISKIGLVVATALTLGSTTAAFVGQINDYPIKPKSRGKRTDAGSHFSRNTGWQVPLFPQWPMFQTPRVSCEALPLPIDDDNGNSNEKLYTLPKADDLASSPDRYERINPPARMNEHSHAVANLLTPGKIETYEIYRNRAVASAASREIVTTSPDPSTKLHHRQHIVTARVHFGDSLDGHPGIVHGGILALALDDIFGFSFHAIGVPMAFTANLSLDYRASLPADSSVLIHVFLEKRDHRKLYFKADVTSLDGQILYTESSCLYIVPRSVWQTMEEKM